MRRIALLLLVTLSGACTASYEPRRSPRIAMLIESGQPVLVRNGERHSVGMLGGGAVEAMADHPLALEYAEAYHQRMILAVACLVGAVAAIVATPFVAGSARTSDEGAERALGLLSGALLLDVLALTMTFSAQPYLYDAVNAFNDAPPPEPPTPSALGEVQTPTAP